MNTIKRTNSVLTVSPSATLVGYEGYFVDANGRVSTSPVGVVVQGYAANRPSSIAILAGGYSGTVLIKLAENVSAYTHVGPISSGLGTASAVASLTKCAQTLEAGTTGELVEAVLYKNA